MKSHDDKPIVFSLLAMALVAGYLGSRLELHKPIFTQADKLNQAAAVLATQQNIVTTSPPPPILELGFAGDIMLSRNVATKVTTQFNGDYSKLFAHADFLKQPDIMFANLEGPVSTKGTDQHNLYSFRMDPKALPALRDAGIDVVSFANNHIGDWGRVAFEDSLQNIRKSGILTCGAGMNKLEAEEPAVINQNGFTVGYLCFSDVGPIDMAATDTQSGILLASDPAFETIIHNAAQKVNTLIVSFHFGVEYQKVHTTRQAELAKRAIDAGAVMVVGSHPHVVEDGETYGTAPILYSLGNFIFDQSFSKDTMQGGFATATLTGKTISNLKLQTVTLDKNYIPSILPITK